MSSIKILNSNFEQVDSLDVSLDLSPKSINSAVVHQVVKAALANRRQGNACTKNKALVRGGGAKPFKQKGTGRARQGSGRSPLLVGGGTVFGPTPRDFSQKVNKKVKIKAIQSIIADKLQAEKLIVVEKLESTGKTKDMFKTLSGRGIKSGLIITDNKDSKALLAVRNLQYCNGLSVDLFSVYEALKYENLVIEKPALEKLLARIQG